MGRYMGYENRTHNDQIVGCMGCRSITHCQSQSYHVFVPSFTQRCYTTPVVRIFPANYTSAKKLCGGFVGGFSRLLPITWQQFIYLFGRMAANSREHISEVFKWVNSVQFTAGHKAVNVCRSFCSGFTAS